MIDHLGLQVSDFQKSREFYLKALKPLGYGLIMEFPNVAGFGADGKPDFWIRQDEVRHELVHVAFRSPDRATVSAFYDAAIKAGGRDNGGPGVRPHYHQNYFGAFVFDPDGNNIEAVCHKPE